MKSSPELDQQRYLALKKELEAEALKKIREIEEKLLTKTSGSHARDIQVLISVNDELEDVLLNWEEGLITPFQNLSPDLHDDDEDDF